jgi:hypothetical protein
MIIEFSRRAKRVHNCHMTEGKKNLWEIKDETLICYGAKKSKSLEII